MTPLLIIGLGVNGTLLIAYGASPWTRAAGTLAVLAAAVLAWTSMDKETAND